MCVISLQNIKKEIKKYIKFFFSAYFFFVFSLFTLKEKKK